MPMVESPTMQRIGDLLPGTLYVANGAYWLITDFKRDERILVVDSLSGKTTFVNPEASVLACKELEPRY